MTGSRLTLLAFLAVLVLPACDGSPGKPKRAEAYVRPSQVLDFETLYSMNCSGCHGAEGRDGGAYPLSNPAYLAWAPRDALRAVVAEGVEGTPMPAFSKHEGGWLADPQIDAVVAGLYDRFAKPGPRDDLPAYASSSAAPPDGRAAAYGRFCADCHGPGGRGTAKGSDIVDPAYLSLVSDQMLRTIVVAGRPDLGMPGFRHAGSAPMTPRDIDAVVGWLVDQRPVY